MTDQSRIRLITILSLVAIVAVVIGFGVYVYHKYDRNPEHTTSFVDRDTGEVVSYQKNKFAEGNAGGNEVVILGSSAVLDNGATSEQYSLVKKALLDYSKLKLGDKYQTLTLIPSSFTNTDGLVAGKLRLGQGGETVDISIKLSQLKFVKLRIADPGGSNGGDYDSGLMSVGDSSYQGTD